MECFRHPGAIAAGMCTACGKGLCRECAREDDGILHCEGTCSEDARLRRQFLADAKEQRAAGRMMMVPVAVILFLCGAALLVLGILWGGFWERVVTIVVGMGVVLFSVHLFVVMRRVVRKSLEQDRQAADR